MTHDPQTDEALKSILLQHWQPPKANPEQMETILAAAGRPTPPTRFRRWALGGVAVSCCLMVVLMQGSVLSPPKNTPHVDDEEILRAVFATYTLEESL